MEENVESKLLSSEEKDSEINEEKIKKAVEKYGSLNRADPFTSANFVSRFLLYWAYRVIKLGNLIPLKSEYFGKLTGKYSSVFFLQNFKSYWDAKGYKFKKILPLVRAEFRANFCYVIIVIILSLIKTGINLLNIDLFREYMKRFQLTGEVEEEDDNSYYRFFSHTQIGIFCIVIKLIDILFQKRWFEYQMYLANKSSTELQCLLFDKLLKISPSSMKERPEMGQITNLLDSDAQRLSSLMLSCPDILTIPTDLLGYGYMLIKFFGFSFIFGIATFLCFMVFNVYYMKKMNALFEKQTILKDKRMKAITETFDNIKIIKLYAWEEEFNNKINDARENELQNIADTFHSMNLNSTIQWFSPVATSVVSIGAYQYYHDVLKIEDIMTSLNIFNSIQGPIRSIPSLVTNVNEVIVSTNRIQKYLFQDEINPSNIIKSDKYMTNNDLSIKIVNGNYSWGVPPTSVDEITMQELKEKGIILDEPKNDDKKKKEILPSIELSTKVSDGDSDSDNENSDKTNDASFIDTDSKEKDKLIEKIDNIEGGLGLDISYGTEKKKINPYEPIIKNINFEVKKGEFVCIIGEVGCGKTSLLEAILNSMIPLSGSSKIYVNGAISYVSQIPWIRNDTIKNNILFYKPYEPERYNKVIDLSELRPDLNIFQAGDLTEIGERGINLSGGQKARVSIARALYADRDIYIFDDPISALDANVGMKVMKNCIVKHLSNKTRILVTHALQYLSFADKIMYMNKGEIKWIGTYEEIKNQDFYRTFYEKMHKQNIQEELKKKKKSEDESKEESSKQDDDDEKEENDNKELNTGTIKRITKDEKQDKETINFGVYKDFLIKIGGFCPIFIVLLLMAIMTLSISGQDLWLSYWTQHQDKSKNLLYYFIFSLLGIMGGLFTYCKERIQSRSNVSASRNIHKEMIESLIRAPIPTFHETVPKGQILNRFSNDIDIIDIGTMDNFLEIINTVILLVNSLAICAYYQPYSLLIVPPILFVGKKISTFYRNASRELNRMESSKRSPVLSLCNEVVPGTSTIRAFGYQQKYMSFFHDKVDDHLKMRMISRGCNQWFDMSLDLVSFTFVAFLISFTIIFKDKFSAEAIALIYTYCERVQLCIVTGIHTFTWYESSMLGYERCVDYAHIKREAPLKKPIDDSLGNWPSKGKIEFLNFSVKYRPDTEIVLKNISFVIQPQEKVGIVGRTGSGKSTITLCLFRILEAIEGRIMIDDVDISSIGLQKLRSSLTIIPQDPAIMEGTLRYNIDPLNRNTDSEILNVMRKQGLNQEIAEGGSNLSVGEKQLICITRAILRKTKIIVMDEATSSIDYKTEELIQKAINELLNNSTFITIAHRIKTIINYDRIMVLDNGQIVNFDSPKNLLNDKKSLFYELYKKSVL